MKPRINNQLPNNLPQLQNLIKKDPLSYYDEFLQQQRHFQSLVDVLQLQPSRPFKEFDELVVFLAQVSHCYGKELAHFPEQLMTILKTHAPILDPDTRTTLCKALILLRNKNILAPTSLLELFFQLLNCHDKELRKFLQAHIITDIKNVNSKHKNAKLNINLQNFMFTMLKDNHATAAKMSLDIMIDLYRKNVWNDSKTVNVIAMALFSKIARILVAALTFFLGKGDDDKNDSDSDNDDDNTPSIREVTMANRINKKSRKRQKQLTRVKNLVKKHKTKEKAPVFNFSALHLINDPQSLAEKLFSRLEGMTERFEVKVMTMDLISRLIGIHQLFVFNFYPFLQRFLQPHQREVTKLLLFAAQSAHELVPPDVLEPVLMTIANNFVAESNSSEVVAVGLNAIRELCARCPLVMSSELLQDLSQYKNNKDKSIAMSSRALIHLYRAINPGLLSKKDKGKPMVAGKEHKVLSYGEVDVKEFVPGAEVLPEEKADDDEDVWESASSDGDGDDSDGEWIDVHHSSDEEGAVSSENAASTQLSVSEKEEKAAAVSQGRILSQDDFHKIRVAQLAKMMQPVAPKGSAQKRKATTSIDASLLEKKELLSLAEIENIHKKPRHDKESRLATVMAGREGREKFGRKKRMNPHASTSNKEKAKKKAFSMVIHKVKKKNKRSFRDKQIALRNALLKQKRMK